MNNSNDYIYENLKFRSEIFKTSKIQFKDENDLLLMAKNERAVSYAKKIFLALFIMIIFFFINIFFNLLNISFNNPYEVEKTKTVYNDRGKIIERNGVIIATNLPTYDFYIDTRKVLNKKTLREKVSKIFTDKTERFINYVFSKNHYILIHNNLKQVEIDLLKKIGDPGISLEKSQKRIYPQHNLFSHSTGFMSKFYKPKSKLEKNLNNKLVNGENLQLTMDITVQTIVHEELTKGMERYNANSALAIVMNVENGEILSMVSLPDFDPNYPEKIGKFSENNLVTEARYEMGSTLKIFNAALAFELESNFENKVFDVEFPYQITEEKKIKDEIKNEKELHFNDIFIKSSNVGSIRLIESIGFEKQRDFFKKLGVLDDTELEGLKSVSNTVPKYWNDTASKFISFGYGISMSPLSLTTTFATLVNGGYKIQPTILKKKDNPKTRILKGNTSSKVNDLLFKIVENGTGIKARVDGLSVGGKTGTSKKLINGYYSDKEIITSFIGIFPLESPKYLTFVLFDEPKNSFLSEAEYYGGNTAAPIFSNIVKRISPILIKENYLEQLVKSKL